MVSLPVLFGCSWLVVYAWFGFPLFWLKIKKRFEGDWLRCGRPSSNDLSWMNVFSFCFKVLTQSMV